jgi:hypothetical protein
MTNYYFLGALLPDLRLGEVPEISFGQFEELLEDNLTTEDLSKTKTLRGFYDICNLLSYWKGDELDPFGNLDKNDLEARAVFPQYVLDFASTYENDEQKTMHFSHLLSTYFIEEIKSAKGFLKAYLSFERELRLVLAAYRSRNLKRNIFEELQHEDQQDAVVEQILAQKDASSYEPPEKYEALKLILERFSRNPVGLQKALDEFRIEKIREMLVHDMFSIDQILGYMVELMLVSKWIKLDKHKGLKIIDSMLKGIP